MKIIHILLGKANPNTMNGVNVVVHNLATAQLKENIDVEVWGITNSPTKIKHEYSYELKLFQKRKFRFFLDNVLVKNLRNLPKNTLVHLHSAFIPEFFSLAILLKKLRLSYIVTPHGAYDKSTMDNKSFKKYLYFNLIERYILNNAKRIHFIGNSEKEHVNKLKIYTDNFLIPNATERVDTTLLKFQHTNSNIIFSYCGRIAVHHKGLDLLIKAFINYKNKGGKGQLKLIGDGEDLSTLVELSKSSKFVNDIQFLGKKFGKEKLNILYSSDVFVHTSRHDGMPIAVLESADLALPLLLSKGTNLGDYVNKYNAGKVLETNDIENIEKSLFEMEKLFYSKELDFYGENAKQMIDKELNWNAIAKEFIVHYNMILGDSNNE